MPQDPTIASALQFVEEADIPRPRSVTRGAADTIAATLDAGKDQAAVVGSDVFSFVSGVTAERREAIINSALLAQLVANKKVSDPDRIYDWYDVYFDVLTNIGWVVQDRGFAEYQETSQNFDAHKAILAVATTLLGAAPTALALVTTTINALRSMDEDRPWIKIFDRESRTARAARFQIGLVEQDPASQFLVALMAFGLEAKATITQVLFFRVRASEATLRHYSGRVAINTTVLDGAKDAIRQKILGHAQDYVATLPDL